MKQKLSVEERLKVETLAFVGLKKVNDKSAEMFDEAKKHYYDVMDEIFDSVADGNSFEFDYNVEAEAEHFKVTKVQKSFVSWDMKKLRVVLGDNASEVVARDYDVIDFVGLAKYVKSLGGELKLFLSFFNVSESVDVKALDNLIEVGEVDEDEVAGCCDVKLGKSWYKVSSKRVES